MYRQSPPPPLQWNPQGVYDWLEGPKTTTAVNKPYLYAIPGLGALLLAAAIFLPWYSINILSTSLTINGLGGTNVPSLGISSANSPASGSSQPLEVWHGWLLLALAVFTLAIVVPGIFLKNKHFAIASIVSGFIAVGLMGYDLAKTTQTINDSYAAAGVSPDVTALSSASVGFGLYIGLAAAFAIFTGSLLIFFLFDRPRPLHTPGS